MSKDDKEILTISLTFKQKQDIKNYALDQGMNVSEATRALYAYVIDKGINLKKYIEVIESL